MGETDSVLASDTESLTFDSLNLALTRCMAAHPPRNPEFQMHFDANTMAGLWGAMNYERRQSVPLEEVDPKVMAAYRRWGPEFGQAASE